MYAETRQNLIDTTETALLDVGIADHVSRADVEYILDTIIDATRPEVTTLNLPAGIAWGRDGGLVAGRVLVEHPDGRREHVATIRYATDADAATALTHMLDALGGNR